MDKKELDLDNADFMVLDIPFGLIPLDIDELYPLSQNAAPKIRDGDSKQFIKNFFKKS